MKKAVEIVGVLLVLISSPIYGTHIVGGNFNVQHLSDSTYQVELVLFRDCAPTNAPMPTSVNFGAYNSLSNSLMGNYTLPLISSNVLQLGDACFQPNDLCVEEGRFSGTVIIPPSYTTPSGFYLAWEICCRNNIITNIFNPGGTGMIYSVDMPHQNTQNSSPNFGPFPTRGYLCVGQEVTLDFGATDTDGDSLVYSLVDPQASSINSGQQPPAPRPFPIVTWESGFSLNNILGSVNQMNIDSKTGVITANADFSGVYVFAIKVEEYRAGIKIGEAIREVQLEAINCPSNDYPVIAPIDTFGFLSPADFVDDTLRIRYKIEPGENVCIRLRAFDDDESSDGTKDSVLVTFNQGQFNTGLTNPVIINPRSDETEVTFNFCWQSDCNDIDQTAVNNQFRAFFTAQDIGCSVTKNSYLELIFNISDGFTNSESFPNVFTPNNDMIHDYFSLEANTTETCLEYDFEIIVYDRWGRKVFESTDLFFRWDGKDETGKDYATGVYYYTVKTSLSDVVQKGFVHLQR